MGLSEQEKSRYHRQMIFPNWGEETQLRLKSSKVFIAGAGGLGSPVSIYLAVAGVGMITIIDMDVVEEMNLNRQILHYDRDIGRKKTASAQEKLEEIRSQRRSCQALFLGIEIGSFGMRTAGISQVRLSGR